MSTQATGHSNPTVQTKYKFYKTTFTKYDLWNLYKLQNEELFVFEVFQLFPIFRMYFRILGVFCTINCYFEYRIRVLCI